LTFIITTVPTFQVRCPQVVETGRDTSDGFGDRFELKLRPSRCFRASFLRKETADERGQIDLFTTRTFFLGTSFVIASNLKRRLLTKRAINWVAAQNRGSGSSKTSPCNFASPEKSGCKRRHSRDLQNSPMVFVGAQRQNKPCSYSGLGELRSGKRLDSSEGKCHPQDEGSGLLEQQ
jgi:hypothetical protein